MSTDALIIANRIKSLRKEKDLTQEELASLMHIHRATLANWETARSIPDMLTLKALANYFDVSVDFIMGRVDDRQLNMFSDSFVVENPTSEFLNPFTKDILVLLKDPDAHAGGNKLREQQRFLIRQIAVEEEYFPLAAHAEGDIIIDEHLIEVLDRVMKESKEYRRLQREGKIK